ncbi:MULTISPECIES: hypothetical protein [Streptococcus anginosus group]|jgi:hypothetical protein|uniref:hypothetical protein n=1 Tax=Streptococcus anginosus group TaxID=671232 RepID=UPI000E3C035E|nr:MULTISPECIES: hypothetical protein [Streptococcus anginosus group]
MKLVEFAELLTETGLTVQYHSFKKGQAPNPPYVVYTTGRPVVQLGDNQQEFKVDTVTVELVTDKKELALEEKLESLLNQSKLFFEKEDETYIDSEELFVVTYSVYLY